MSDARGTTTRPRSKRWLFLGGVFVVLIAVFSAGFVWAPLDSLAKVDGAAGRTLVIEAATFGRSHSVGRSSFLPESLLKRLPAVALKYIEPKRPRSETMSDGDSLVIWGHSRLSVREDGTAGLLGHRIVIVDSSGRVWPAAAQRFFYPRNGFARTATVFDAYPR